MNILVSYRAAPRMREWETGAMIARALRRAGHSVNEYAKIYESDQWLEDPEELRNFKYDLILYCECNDGEPQYTELRQVPCDEFVLSHFDSSYYNQHGLQVFARHMNFDHAFVANPLFERLSFWGCKTSWLPYAADPEYHVRPLDFPHDMKVCLVGSERKDRNQLIRKLKRKGVKAELISNRFKEDYINTLAGNLIQINQNPPAGRGLMNMRQFEAPAAGALVLAQHGDFVERAFEPDQECILYTDENDLVRICQGLMQDPDRVHRIREAGQKKVLAEHTYDHRAKTILETVF